MIIEMHVRTFTLSGIMKNEQREREEKKRSVKSRKRENIVCRRVIISHTGY
jgi:hypothetical protein